MIFLQACNHFYKGNIDKNDLYDAPESRDNVNDIFEKATNVLEKESINHNDKTMHNSMYNTITSSGSWRCPPP